jgi:hypothetical protein
MKASELEDNLFGKHIPLVYVINKKYSSSFEQLVTSKFIEHSLISPILAYAFQENAHNIVNYLLSFAFTRKILKPNDYTELADAFLKHIYHYNDHTDEKNFFQQCDNFINLMENYLKTPSSNSNIELDICKLSCLLRDIQTVCISNNKNTDHYLQLLKNLVKHLSENQAKNLFLTYLTKREINWWRQVTIIETKLLEIFNGTFKLEHQELPSRNIFFKKRDRTQDSELSLSVLPFITSKLNTVNTRKFIFQLIFIDDTDNNLVLDTQELYSEYTESIAINLFKKILDAYINILFGSDQEINIKTHCFNEDYNETVEILYDFITMLLSYGINIKKLLLRKWNNYYFDYNYHKDLTPVIDNKTSKLQTICNIINKKNASSSFFKPLTLKQSIKIMLKNSENIKWILLYLSNIYSGKLNIVNPNMDFNKADEALIYVIIETITLLNNDAHNNNNNSSIITENLRILFNELLLDKIQHLEYRPPNIIYTKDFYKNNLIKIGVFSLLVEADHLNKNALRTFKELKELFEDESYDDNYIKLVYATARELFGSDILAKLRSIEIYSDDEDVKYQQQIFNGLLNDIKCHAVTVNFYKNKLLDAYKALLEHRNQKQKLEVHYEARENHFIKFISELAKAPQNCHSLFESALKHTPGLRAFSSKHYIPLLKEVSQTLSNNTSENFQEGFNKFIDEIKKESDHKNSNDLLDKILKAVDIDQAQNKVNLNNNNM